MLDEIILFISGFNRKESVIDNLNFNNLEFCSIILYLKENLKSDIIVLFFLFHCDLRSALEFKYFKTLSSVKWDKSGSVFKDE